MNYTKKDKCFFRSCQRRYYVRKFFRKLRSKLHLPEKKEKMLYGRTLVDLNSAQERIFELIQSGKPCMIGRMGGVEGRAVLQAISIQMGLCKEIDSRIAQPAYINAGFFPPTKEAFVKFSHLMVDSVKQVDVLGSMPTNNEEFLVQKNLSREAMITHIGCLEPYYSESPWSRALKGKKVLVIYPFADSIQRQYKKREKLFDNPDILPEFELKTLKAVQSIAGTKTEFKDWFEALDYMYTEALKIDFDIAIIGCGAYGFPLAAKLKQAGKQAIHLGGATQILFGVWGARWDSIAPIKALKNEHWIRPSEEETPQGVEKVEGACYW